MRQIRVLKEAIRMMVEAAVSGEQAVKERLALFRGQKGPHYYYVLYDPKALVDEASDDGFFSMRFNRSLDQIVLGFIKGEPREGDCNDAMEIKMSAASKGYGPLMYDIVMSDGTGGIVPDRISTSGRAKNVWKHYSSKRADVKKVPLDDYDDPKTPDPCDDCQIVKDDDDVLNYSYDGPGQPAAKSKLMNVHDDVVAGLAERGIKRQAIELMLMRMGQALFDAKYGE